MRISDWSSDVCSSDLATGMNHGSMAGMAHSAMGHGAMGAMDQGGQAMAGHDMSGMDMGSMNMRDFSKAPRVKRGPGGQTSSPMPVEQHGAQLGRDPSRERGCMVA